MTQKVSKINMEKLFILNEFFKINNQFQNITFPSLFIIILLGWRSPIPSKKVATQNAAHDLVKLSIAIFNLNQKNSRIKY